MWWTQKRASEGAGLDARPDQETTDCSEKLASALYSGWMDDWRTDVISSQRDVQMSERACHHDIRKKLHILVVETDSQFVSIAACMCSQHIPVTSFQPWPSINLKVLLTLYDAIYRSWQSINAQVSRYPLFMMTGIQGMSILDDTPNAQALSICCDRLTDIHVAKFRILKFSWIPRLPFPPCDLVHHWWKQQLPVVYSQASAGETEDFDRSKIGFNQNKSTRYLKASHNHTQELLKQSWLSWNPRNWFETKKNQKFKTNSPKSRGIALTPLSIETLEEKKKAFAVHRYER